MLLLFKMKLKEFASCCQCNFVFIYDADGDRIDVPFPSEGCFLFFQIDTIVFRVEDILDEDRCELFRWQSDYFFPFVVVTEKGL